MKRISYPAVALLACLVAGGCASFDSDWKSTARYPTPTNDITGCWIGTWKNTNNTHSDQLQAIIRRTGVREWDVHFHAFYGKLLEFSHRTKLTGDEQGERVNFTGEENLGWLVGGTFRYVGNATPTNFFSTYENKYDSGTFTLRRP